jgi:hypothetical protein
MAEEDGPRDEAYWFGKAAKQARRMAEELDGGADANMLLQVAQMYEAMDCGEQPNQRVAQTAEPKLRSSDLFGRLNPDFRQRHHRLGRQFGQRNFGSATR